MYCGKNELDSHNLYKHQVDKAFFLKSALEEEDRSM